MKPRWQASELIRTRSRSNTRMRKRRRKGDGCACLAASPAFPGLPTLLRLPTYDKSPENHLFFLGRLLGHYSSLYIFPSNPTGPTNVVGIQVRLTRQQSPSISTVGSSLICGYVGTNILIHQLKRNKISGITFHVPPPACAACL